ncbi:MAG: flagellar hook-associated protein FlgK [Alphaproteobacteria bacterium]|nr:flagellar hook-associated protein FlgK [Alphaproteobacteria bacterium]MBN9569039.1 flagellar hook-associated protein FlgK [Alphaproteobacteria bacterium]MBN9571764.1 flagellar hook-associated protein FlgK [Alphaproteobacteria bacterium]MBN9577462.1 flagellar hook-associated protein FlgK [Alphaproteobacteria bacterium]
MSLNGILSSALTALHTNTAALRVVSNNVANINTPDYARRVVNQQTLVTAGQLSGVDIADIQRVVDKFLNQETLSANGQSSRYDTQSTIFDQLNGLLGQPGDGTALTSQLDNVFAALSNAALAPTASTSQQGILNAFQNLATTVSSLSSAVSGLQAQVDQQVGTAVDSVNNLIKQIYGLNQQIQTATANGDTSTGLLDQRDLAVKSLSALVDVRTVQQPNGQLSVMTEDGMNLVGDSYAQLSYQSGGVNGSFSAISIANVNPATGAAIGPAQPLDPHLQGGTLKGLVDMRDGALAQLQQEIGSFAQKTAAAFNAQHNANAAYPPPTSLDGRDTGLLAGDGLNFTGKTTIAVTASDGTLVSRIDVDFGAGTLSVDGGATASIGTTIGSFATALNTALGTNGTASFADGQLSLSATGGNGLVVQDDATTPSSRAGTGFSQFFGLNDIFSTGVPSNFATGLSASDAGGFAAGGTMSFVLRDQSGNVGKQASVTLTAGMTIGDIVTALNTGFGGAASFSLGSDGTLTMTPAAQFAGYSLNVTDDTTQRGTTGVSVSALFGLGSSALGNIAAGFSLNADLAQSPQRLALGQPSITAASVAGDTIISSGDNRGLLALQNVGTTNQSFAAAGALGARSASLTDYAASLYQDIASRSQSAQTAQTAQSNRLAEAQSRQSQTSGVNLDEELSNMMMYQQAYSAGARMLQVVQQLYDTLLQIQ